MSDVPWRIGPPANDEDMPEVGKTVQAGDSVAVCTKVEWRYVPPTTEGEPVECHSQEVAEACVRGHGGHIEHRPVYSVTWLAPGARTAEGMPDHGGVVRG